MTLQETEIGGRNCRIHADEKPEILLIQPMGRHELPTIGHEAALIGESSPVPFVLAAFEVRDWDLELTPWPDPAISRKPGVGEGARKTLEYVSSVLLPSLRRRFGSLPCVLGGYSLGALFALWVSCETSCFEAVAASSPSVWIRDWNEYAAARPTRSSAVYLSLGDQEEKVRNPHIARVGDNLRDSHERLARQLGADRTILEWNEGNHFKDNDIRTARGFLWCLRKVAVRP